MGWMPSLRNDSACLKRCFGTAMWARVHYLAYCQRLVLLVQLLGWPACMLCGVAQHTVTGISRVVFRQDAGPCCNPCPQKVH